MKPSTTSCIACKQHPQHVRYRLGCAEGFLHQELHQFLHRTLLVTAAEEGRAGPAAVAATPTCTKAALCEQKQTGAGTALGAGRAEGGLLSYVLGAREEKAFY